MEIQSDGQSRTRWPAGRRGCNVPGIVHVDGLRVRRCLSCNVDRRPGISRREGRRKRRMSILAPVPVPGHCCVSCQHIRFSFSFLSPDARPLRGRALTLMQLGQNERYRYRSFFPLNRRAVSNFTTSYICGFPPITFTSLVSHDLNPASAEHL
jgi:hypothetical protein